MAIISDNLFLVYVIAQGYLTVLHSDVTLFLTSLNIFLFCLIFTVSAIINGSGYFDIKTLPLQPFLAKFWPHGHKAENKTFSTLIPAAAAVATKRYF